MKHTIRIFATTLLLATAVSCSKTTVDPALPPPVEVQKDLDEIDARVLDYINKYKIPGASLAISKDGKLVYRKGYGLADKVANTLVKTDSQFRLGGISATYTGVAILKMVQEGKFKLNDKVFGQGALLGTKYGKKPYSDDVKKITVRQLLLMTSGGFVTENLDNPINLRPELNNDDYFDWMMDNTKLAFAPGTAYQFLGIGYFVAGRIVEKFSGKRYIDYLKEDILEPIGDTSTELGKPLKNQKYAKEVTYYAQGATSGSEYSDPIERYDANAGLLATSTDVLRFFSAVDGFPTRPDILNKTSLELLITPSNFVDFYGMGIAISKEYSIWYNNGSLPGTRTYFLRHDNGMSAVLLMNGNPDFTDFDVYDPSSVDLQNLMFNLVQNPQRDFQKIDQFR